MNVFSALSVGLLLASACSRVGPRMPEIPPRTLAGPAAARVEVRYREPADIFEILDHVSEWWPGYVEPEYRRFWLDSVAALSPLDAEMFARYRVLRERHYDRTGQADAAPRRDGAGLFTARAALLADPVAAAFYESDSMPQAFDRLRVILSPDELAFLRGFHAHFSARVAPLVAASRARSEASRAATARALADSGVATYVEGVARLLGAEPGPPLVALYLWWPDSGTVRASPNGRHLLMRVRPGAAEAINGADVVVHEMIHVLAARQPDAQRLRVSAALLDRCAPPAGVKRLAVIEEPIATALGNIEFRRRFQPRRFAWGRRWYGDDWVDLYARLLHAPLTEALAAGRGLDAALVRDAGELCGVASRSATPR
jgi:hypothetical protein